MRILLLACCLLPLGSAVLAEPVTIPIPKQDWKISFDAPAFTKKKGEEDGPNYVYQAHSGRFNLSLFVEPQAAAGGSKECYEHYWPMASRNPMIAPATVQASHTDTYYRVAYDIVVEGGGKSLTQKNVNYYFMFGGKWVDLHVSIISPIKDDEGIFAALDKSLTYGK